MPAKAVLRLTFPPHVEVSGLNMNKQKVKLREVRIPLFFSRPNGETSAAFVEVIGEVAAEGDFEGGTVSAGDFLLQVSGKHGGVRVLPMRTDKLTNPPAFLTKLLEGATLSLEDEGEEEEEPLDDEEEEQTEVPPVVPVVPAEVKK